MLLDKLLPANDTKRKWISIGVTVLISGLLTMWGIYGIGQYGIALFILTPLFIGAGSTFFYGYHREITFAQALSVSFLSLVICTLALLLCAIEGLICIFMAAPFGMALTFLGCFICHRLLRSSRSKAPTALMILVLSIPLTAFIEKDSRPPLVSVTTSITINAPPEVVWRQVIEFPQLSEPEEFIFKAGIAYPTNAKIDGKGVGAIRHCNFTTGSFVEPITVWDEPRLLKFDVAGQPAPMKELSFWDIDAPHLHDFFVSKKGQFKLTALPNGETLLEGTTWYYHNIRPQLYWQLWSNFIIHKIHNRVLTHIKSISEA
jgi:hypothetical protein